MPLLGAMYPTTDPDEMGMQGGGMPPYAAMQANTYDDLGMQGPGAGGPRLGAMFPQDSYDMGMPQLPPQAPAPTPEVPAAPGGGFWSGLGKTLGTLAQGAVGGMGLAFEPGRQIMAQGQQMQAQQEALALRKKQQDQQAMAWTAEMMEKLGTLPPGGRKDFLLKKFAEQYKGHTGQDMDPDFLTMIKKEDEQGMSEMSAFIQGLREQGVNLQGLDELIKRQPEKALAIIVQRQQVEKTAMGMQKERAMQDALKQLDAVGVDQPTPGGQPMPPTPPGGPPPAPPGPPTLGAQVAMPAPPSAIPQGPIAPPGSLGAQMQSVPPLPSPALAGGLAPSAQAGLPAPVPQPGVLPSVQAAPLGATPRAGQTPGVDLARRAQLVEKMRRAAPFAAQDEAIGKRYAQMDAEVKHIDEQANRSREELNQAQTQARAGESLVLDKARFAEEQQRTKMEAQRIQIAQRAEARQQQEWGIKQKETMLDIATKERKAGGILTGPEATDLTIKLQDQAKTQPAIKLWEYNRGAFQTMQEGFASNTPAGDLLMINAFNALNQPTPNAVTMGEVQNVEQGQAKLMSLLNIPAKFFKGTRIVDQYREDLMTRARAVASSRAVSADAAAAEHILPLADRAKIPRNQVYTPASEQLKQAVFTLSAKDKTEADALLKELQIPDARPAATPAAAGTLTSDPGRW